MISLIVPVYNAEKEIKSCVQSLREQSYTSIEILLINDGSTDKTGEICDALAKTDSRIRVIHTKNNGQGQARNIGITYCGGEFIAFVDADDQLPKKALEYLMEPLKHFPYDIISGAYDRKVHGKKHRIQPCPKGRICRFGTRQEIKRYHIYKTTSGFGYVWGKIYRRTFLEKCGVRFNRQKKAFMEDSLFNIKLMAYAPRYYVTDEGVYVYNIVDGSTSNQKDDIFMRARSVLINYATFLNEKKVLNENIDLAIPFGFRIMLWTLFKEWEMHGVHLHTTHDILNCFFSMKVIRQWLKTPGAIKACLQVQEPLESLMYSMLYFTAKFKAQYVLSGMFIIGRPVLSRYVHRKVRGNI